MAEEYVVLFGPLLGAEHFYFVERAVVRHVQGEGAAVNGCPVVAVGGLLEVFAEIFGGRYEEAQRGTLLEEAAVGRVEEVRSQAFPAEVGMDGKPRELHVEKAKDVTTLCPAKAYPETPVEKHDGFDIKLLSSCEYFTTYRVNVDTKAEFEADEKSFNSILVLEGSPVISGNGTVNAKKGDSIFIGAGSGKYTVEGKCTVILTKV